MQLVTRHTRSAFEPRLIPLHYNAALCHASAGNTIQYKQHLNAVMQVFTSATSQYIYSEYAWFYRAALQRIEELT